MKSTQRRIASALTILGCTLAANVSYADWPVDDYSPARALWGGVSEIGQCKAGVQTESGVTGGGSFYALGGEVHALLPNGNPIAIPVVGVLAAECAPDNSSVGPTDDAVEAVTIPAFNVCRNFNLPEDDCEIFATSLGGALSAGLTAVSPTPFIGMYDYFNGAKWKWFGKWVYWAVVESRQTFLTADGDFVAPPPNRLFNWNVPLGGTDDVYPSPTFMLEFNDEVNVDEKIEVLGQSVELNIHCSRATAEVFRTNRHKRPSPGISRIKHDAGQAGSCTISAKDTDSKFGFVSVGITLAGGLSTVYEDFTKYSNYQEGNTLSELYED